MPPPAANPDVAGEAGPPPTLDDASARLESALARLEALVEAGPLQSELFRPRAAAPTDAALDTDTQALRTALDAARDRERALEAAATQASAALGRAMEEVRHALDASEPPEEDGDGEDDGSDAALDPAATTAEEPQP